ncbi:hypothetical protein KSP39_PZI011458 [Platanthera zijinensis]|uniref:Uncharacterized protein n=1 Tax=Platanthera zijinensis TaxID=2320716 RepID=A0AAP0BH01_9ASPA
MLAASCAADSTPKEMPETQPLRQEETVAERLNRHRLEMAGKIWTIPEIWGQEGQLKAWSDCSAFDRSLAPDGLLSARMAMIAEYRRTKSGGMSIENHCL